MKIAVQVLDVTYEIENNETSIKLYCKTKDNMRLLAIDRNFDPYFYVIPEKDEEILEKKLQELSIAEENNKITIKCLEKCKIGNIRVLKVYVHVPTHIKAIKDVIKTWPEVKGKREFDIPTHRRYLIDKNITPTRWHWITGKEIPNPKDQDLCIEIEKIEKARIKEKPNFTTMAFDLEVIKGKIVAASFYSKDFKKVITSQDFEKKQWYVELVKSERELLERFIEIINKRRVDILVGYNSDQFDFEVLRKKADKYNLELSLGVDRQKMIFQRRGRVSAAKITGRIHLDLYVFIANLLSPELKSETLTLNKVANEILGEKKDELDWEDLKEFWSEHKNLDKLTKYCLKDAELTYKLAGKINPIIFSLSALIGQLPFDICHLTYGQLVEQFLIRKACEKNLLVPNRPKRNQILQRRGHTYEGAFVLEPDKGLYEKLVMLDYRSLYPSIIASHNISPETLDCFCCNNTETVLKHHFCKKRRGFIPEVIKSLMKERFSLKARLKKLNRVSQEYKDINTRQLALKYILNSFYGYMGYPSARWYCRECAESVTALGRNYIKKTIEEARSKGLNVIYSDTDSILLQVDNKSKAIEFQKYINKKLPKFMELEIEDFYKRGLFTYTEKGIGAKKRYALLNYKGELRIKGFERVRRDWCKLAKEIQEKVIRLVLEDKVPEAVKLVNKKIQEIKNKEVSMKELGIYEKLTKHPESYEITAPHVQAAKKAIERGLKIKPGQTITYVVTEGTGRISDRAELLRFATSYDSNYYIENQILPAVLRVLKVLGYTEGDFLEKGRQTSLGKFAR